MQSEVLDAKASLPQDRHGSTLLGLINFARRGDLLADISTRMRSRRGFAVATMNLDHLVKLRRLPGFRTAYRRHSHVVADGRPVIWLRRLAGDPVELIPGSELIGPLMALAVRNDVPVGFLGSTDEALALAAERLTAAHPGLRVVARVAPAFQLDSDGAEASAALDSLAAAGVRLVLVALGAPKQEMLAIRGLERMPECGFVSVGAGLDFIAGTQRRAPRWLRRLALEWLWRLLGDPKRLAGRYLACFAILPGLTVGALRLRLRGPAAG